MLLIHLMQDLPNLMANISPNSEIWVGGHPLVDLLGLGQQTVLAQQFETDVFANVRRSWSNFVESGQLWAFLAGLVIGYLVNSFTSYGR